MSPAVESRLIRGGALGSLRVPGPAITSDQTIHKAGRAATRGEESGEASGKISSAGAAHWMAGWFTLGRIADNATAAAAEVLSKLFSRASRVESRFHGENGAETCYAPQQRAVGPAMTTGQRGRGRRMNVGYRSFIASGCLPRLP